MKLNLDKLKVIPKNKLCQIRLRKKRSKLSMKLLQLQLRLENLFMTKNQLIYMLINKKIKLKEIDKLQLKKQMMIKKEQMLKLKKLKVSSSHKLQEKKLSLKRKLLQLKLQKRNTKIKSLIFSQNCKLFIMKELKKKMLQEQRKKQNTKLNWLHSLPIK